MANETIKLIRNQLVTEIFRASILAGVIFVTMYFRVDSMARAITNLEENSVRKDVLNETLTSMKEDIRDIKDYIKETPRDNK